MRHQTRLETEGAEDRPGTRRSGGIDRRSALKAATVTVLGTGLAGCMGQGNGSDQGPSPKQIIENSEDNYYSWFVEGEKGFRSTRPFVYNPQKNDNLWRAQPTSDGGVRCRIENAGSGTAGFELSIGPLGEINSVTIQSRSGGDAKVFYALYLDKNDDGEFYKWKKTGDIRQRFTGYGKDKEAVSSFPAGKEITIDDDANLKFTGNKPTTLEELRQGKFQGIGGSTATALFVGVLGNASDNRELVIEDVDVETSSTT